MKKKYKVEKNTLTDLLKEIDQFETKMNNFIDKFPTYNYEVNINKTNNVWCGEVKITNDEKTKIT